MGTDDSTPPVSDDDFAEFAEPPRHKPPIPSKLQRSEEAAADGEQSKVDDVIARLRREREEGKR